MILDKYHQDMTNRPLPVLLVMVCIYIFLFIERPWESIRHLEGIPIERVYAILMIVVALLHHKLKIVSSPTNKWVYGLLALHFLLAPFAFNTGDAIYQGIEYAKLVVLYLLMLSVADDEESLKLLIKAYIFSMMFYLLHSLWEYHNGRHQFRMGISRMVGADSTYNDPNAFGASVVLALPFVYTLLRTEQNSLHCKLYYVYFVLSIVCVVLTGSRSAFIALVFLTVLWVFAQRGIRRIKMIIAALLSVCVLWVSMPAEKQERIRTLWDTEAGPENAHESAEGRLIGWVVSWRMFKREPFTGVGPGGKNFIGYRMSHDVDPDPRHRGPAQPHILYGQVLAGFGVGGALLFSGLIVSIFRCCLSVRSRLMSPNKNKLLELVAGAIIIATTLLLLLGFGGHNFYRPLWLWLAAWSTIAFKLAHSRSTYLG